jgi:hypothetical protein
MSPFHLVRYEVETHKGPRNRYAPGIKSLSIWDSNIKGELTDAKIDQYVRDGTYRARHKFMAEKKRQKQVSDILPRMVYDCVSQDFVEVK